MSDQRLTDAELALMERLWAPHQTYVRDLLDEVYRIRSERDALRSRLDKLGLD